MTSDLQKLQSVISDTKKLICLAEEGDWDALVMLEKTRDVELKQLFETSPDIEPSVLADGIQFILDKNKILTQFSLSQRDSIRMEMSKAGHAHKAVSAYLTTA
jgi:flagellar protein FliT